MGGRNPYHSYRVFSWHIHVGANRSHGRRSHAGGYCRVFHFDNDAPTLSNKAVDALRKGLRGALAEYWKEHGKKLAE